MTNVSDDCHCLSFGRMSNLTNDKFKFSKNSTKGSKYLHKKWLHFTILQNFSNLVHGLFNWIFSPKKTEKNLLQIISKVEDAIANNVFDSFISQVNEYYWVIKKTISEAFEVLCNVVKLASPTKIIGHCIFSLKFLIFNFDIAAQCSKIY